MNLIGAHIGSYVVERGEILIAHLTRMPVPPRRRNPNLPPEWEALCLRMMEKSREARFQSVTQLAHAGSTSARSRPRPTRRRRRCR